MKDHERMNKQIKVKMKIPQKDPELEIKSHEGIIKRIKVKMKRPGIKNLTSYLQSCRQWEGYFELPLEAITGKRGVSAYQKLREFPCMTSQFRNHYWAIY